MIKCVGFCSDSQSDSERLIVDKLVSVCKNEDLLRSQKRDIAIQFKKSKKNLIRFCYDAMKKST